MPGVVAEVLGCVGWLGELPLEPPPPQPLAPAMMATNNSSSIQDQRRWRDGIPIINSRPSAEPPLSTQDSGLARDADEADVVFTVIVVVPVPAEDKVRVVGFKVQLGTLCAPAGEAVRAQVKLIVPL